MVKLINRNGSVMYVHESRVEEYKKAGFLPDVPKPVIKEPLPLVEPKAELKEEPKRGLANPKAKTEANKKPKKKTSAKK